MTADAHKLVPGAIVAERYRIVDLLGEGGMGRVFRAVQLNLGREVALKLLLPGAIDAVSGVERFMREAKVAASLRHPAAVDVYDVGVDGSLVFIAMELLSGSVLRSLMQEGVPLSLPDAVEIASQLADLLVEAHAMGLVHRDLKPENVFIEPPLRVRVVDFGLAFIEGGLELGRITREGVVVGTPAYLSPEQAQGLQVGTAADIYAFGCMLYELVTGVPPFRGSQINVLTQHLYVAPTRPRERAPDVGIPGELDDLVIAMMAKRVPDRPSASAVLAQLELVRRTLGGERLRGRDALPRCRAARRGWSRCRARCRPWRTRSCRWRSSCRGRACDWACSGVSPTRSRCRSRATASSRWRWTTPAIRARTCSTSCSRSARHPIAWRSWSRARSP
ncbi:MAG: serine/threonine-protein kinase [Nannocystaceae bacterium]